MDSSEFIAIAKLRIGGSVVLKMVVSPVLEDVSVVLETRDT